MACFPQHSIQRVPRHLQMLYFEEHMHHSPLSSAPGTPGPTTGSHPQQSQLACVQKSDNRCRTEVPSEQITQFPQTTQRIHNICTLGGGSHLTHLLGTDGQVRISTGTPITRAAHARNDLHHSVITSLTKANLHVHSSKVSQHSHSELWARLRRDGKKKEQFLCCCCPHFLLLPLVPTSVF